MMGRVKMERNIFGNHQSPAPFPMSLSLSQCTEYKRYDNKIIRNLGE